MKNNKKNFLRIFLILLIIGILQLSCNGVSSTDERLQEPINAMTDEFRKLIKQLKVLVGVDIIAPWITYPIDQLFNSESEVLLKGWIPNTEEADLVIYIVDPDPSLSAVINIMKELTRIKVNEDTTEWEANVTLPEKNQFIAARIEKQLGISSPFSNIIYVSQGTPEDLKIISPEQDETVTTDIMLKGTGEPQLGLILWINGEKTPFSTKIEDDGSWQLTGIPLVVAGFDKKDLSKDVNKNILEVHAEATQQKASLTVRKLEPIGLVWPFGTIKNDKYNPDVTKGYVTSFYMNDWHKYARNSDHPALDISTSSGTNVGSKIHAIADGIVVAHGWKTYEGGYLVVDSGGFGVLYLHILEYHPEEEFNKDFPNIVNKGDIVTAGQVIATEGYTSTSRGNTSNMNTHLHLQVFIWDTNVNKTVYGNVYDQAGLNINPSSNYKDYFKSKNINFYDYWGGSDYCLSDECWISVDWKKVNTGSVSKLYETSCITEMLKLTKSPFSTRLRWCSSDPKNCPCGSK